MVKKLGPIELSPNSTKSVQAKMKLQYSKDKYKKSSSSKETISGVTLEEPCFLYMTSSSIKNDQVSFNPFTNVTCKKKVIDNPISKINEACLDLKNNHKKSIKLLPTKAQVFQREKRKDLTPNRKQGIPVSINNEKNRLAINEYMQRPIFNIIIKRSSSKSKICS